MRPVFTLWCAAVALFVGSGGVSASEALPSWREGAARNAIVGFVARVSDGGSADFVPEAERIAVFDNDGCLWAERPVYFQLIYAMDRVRAMAPDHPEWRETQPFKAVLEGDTEALTASGKEGLLTLIMATHAGMTEDECADSVREWLRTARHPETGRPYTEMVYRPMLEVLDYLHEHGFKVFIVSGGGVDFIRVFSEEVYGIPRERVVGSSIDAAFELRGGRPVVVKSPSIDLIDDKAGKPVGIHRHIGRRPIAAFGNSDGDLQMLQYTTAGEGARLGVLIRHTDAEREWAYDRDSHVGRLDEALDEAPARGWVVVDMARAWKRVFADE